jgi:hypothetical protein
MKLEEAKINCQIPCLQLVGEGMAPSPRESLSRRIKLMARRRLSPKNERAFKTYTNDLMNRFSKIRGKGGKPSSPPAKSPAVRLQAGHWVRVRSRGEIEATLNHWRQLKGCTFMPEMARYCGTTQRVLKPMKRFVDERDLRVKKSSGIILLEGVMCEGTSDFGGCDRSCLYFWREEWLENIAAPDRVSLEPR